MNKIAKAAVKPATAAKTAKPKASGCACPYCDEDVTDNKTPLFCSPCTPCGAATTSPVKKPQTKKAKSSPKTTK